LLDGPSLQDAGVLHIRFKQVDVEAPSKARRTEKNRELRKGELVSCEPEIPDEAPKDASPGK
jgi:hypothetical protein